MHLTYYYVRYIIHAHTPIFQRTIRSRYRLLSLRETDLKRNLKSASRCYGKGVEGEDPLILSTILCIRCY